MLSKKIQVFSQILILSLILFSFVFVLNSQAVEKENNRTFTTTGYRTTDVIEINGNDDFDQELWNEDGRSDGSACCPWILDGYEFVDVRFAIVIENVDDYFIIRNCSFKNTEDDGIYISNTDNGRICKNFFNSCGIGIGIHQTSTNNNRIFNNTFEECLAGIILKGAGENNYICNNYFLSNTIGITASETSHIYIYSNLMVLNSRSIDFEMFVKHSTISYNTIFNSTFDGLKLTNSNWNDISRNNFENNTEYGVKLIDSSCNEITQNNFIFNNRYGISQGYDDLDITSWTENYWWFLLTDVYIIDGPGGNKDYTPSEEIIDIGTIDCQCNCIICDCPVPTNSQGVIFSIFSVTILALCVYIRRKK